MIFARTVFLASGLGLLLLISSVEVGAQEQASAAQSAEPSATPAPADAACEAQPSRPRWTLYLGGLMGGASTFDGNNPYGYGLGVQAGITLGRPEFYFGISFPWYAGDDRAFQFAFDLGYDFRSGPAVLRPLVAVGADRWRLEQAAGPDLKQGAVLFEVGWHLHFDLGARAYLGAEFRWAYTSHGGDDSSWHAWGVFGARLSG